MILSDEQVVTREVKDWAGLQRYEREGAESSNRIKEVRWWRDFARAIAMPLPVAAIMTGYRLYRMLRGTTLARIASSVPNPKQGVPC